MNNHINTELLLNYTNGNVEPALSLAIALHQKQCKSCHQKISDLESNFGHDIETSESSDFEESSFERLITDLDKLSKVENSVSHAPKNVDRENINVVDFGADDTLSYAVAEINKPLLDQLANFNQDDYQWQKLSSKISTTTLELFDSSFKVNLLRFSAHAKIPRHTHLGKEFTYVIEGDFKDHKGTHTAGDFIACDASDEHKPIVGAAGCVCLAVTDAPLHFTGVLGPIFNRYASY
jgi:putative transcriptional regulator